MATLGAGPTSLLSLPSELIANAALFAENYSLIALRASCRRVADATDHEFIKRFFASRTHIYTEHSLKVLADIANTPRFASRLRELRLVVLRYVGIKNSDTPSYLTGVALHTAWSHQVPGHQSAVSQISTVLDKLKSCGQPLSIGIASGCDKLDSTVYGFRQVTKATWISRDNLVQSKCEHATDAILFAMSAVNANITNLDICGQTFCLEDRYEFEPFRPPKHLVDAERADFARLEALTLGQCDNRWFESRLVSRSVGSIGNLLSVAENLKSISFCGRSAIVADQEWYGDGRTKARRTTGIWSGCITSVKVQNISITDLLLDLGNVWSMIVRHRDTLTTLTLHAVCLNFGADASRLSRVLAAASNLE